MKRWCLLVIVLGVAGYAIVEEYRKLGTFSE